MEIIRDDNTISCDIKEVLAKWHTDFSNSFSGLQQNPDLAFDDNFLKTITDLKKQLDSLSPEEQQDQSSINSDYINTNLTYDEVSGAIDRAKSGKAYLDIPNEALQNEQAKLILFKFFSVCFQHGLSPYDWSLSDIKPVEKPGKEPRIPLNQRPITIMDNIVKIYSSILNKRI